MEQLEFTDFLETISERDRDYARELNRYLLDNGCTRDIKPAKSGPVVSYVRKDTKKTLVNFVCRKTGVKLRIYPQFLSNYSGFLDTLPSKMKKEIANASVCKRLIDPTACNSRCPMGYDFFMDQEHYQKCRYMAFMPTLNEDNNAFIKLFLENELSFNQI